MEIATNIDKSIHTDISTLNHIHFLVFRTTESMTLPSMTRTILRNVYSFLFLFTVHDLPLYTLSSKINEDRTIVVEKVSQIQDGTITEKTLVMKIIFLEKILS